MPSGIDSRVSIGYQGRWPQKFTPLPDSLVSGPLAQTSAFLSKVSTTPKSPGQSYQHVICVYLPDVFDKDEVTKVRCIRLCGLEGFETVRFTGDESTST